MLPLVIENIIYSYLRQVSCLKNKKINDEIKDNLTLCEECQEYKVIMMRCTMCFCDFCVCCTYKTHYYINGKEYFNNYIVNCQDCHDSLCCQDYDYDSQYDEYDWQDNY